MDISSLSINFLINLIAGIVGILIVLWIERQKRPELSMRVGVPGRIGDNDPLGRQAATWVKIQIHNSNMPRWLRWVYDREPALACRAWITFHHLDGRRVFDREMNARWSETPEPRVEVKQTEKGQVGILLGVQDSVDIPPGEYTNVDIAIRVKSDTDCYGWNNESYLYNWEHPAWKLEKGRYVARVRVKTGGREFVDAFLIVNDIPHEDFRLEPVEDELKKRLK